MLRGDRIAANRVLAHLLPALRREARKRLKGEHRGADVETDVLVDTAVRRVIRPAEPLSVNDREHFLNLSKLQMNRKLIERSRLVGHRRHGVELRPDHAVERPEPGFVAHAALAAAWVDLRRLEPLLYRVLTRRDVYGDSWQEVAEAAGLTVPAAKYRHELALQWLARRLGAAPGA